MVYFILVLFTLLFAFFFRKHTINLSKPYFLLWCTWGVGIGVCLLNIFKAYPAINYITYTFVIINLITISICFHFGQKSTKINFQSTRYDINRLKLSLNILFCLVSLAYIVTILKLGLPPLFSGSDRSTYYLSGGGELVYLLVYPAFFISLILIKKDRLTWPLFIKILILSFFLISKSNKMSIFSILLMVCVIFGKRMNISKIFIGLAIIFIIFGISSYVYTKSYSNQQALKTARIALTGFSLPIKYYYLYDPLIYISSNIYNLNSLVINHMSSQGYGIESFPGIAQLVAVLFPQVSEASNTALLSMDSVLPISLFNTFSGLGLLYYDFGNFFSTFIMGCVSFACGCLYVKTAHSESIFTMFLYYLLYQTIVLSFFTFYLGNMEVITNLLVIIMIDLFCRQQSSQH